MELPREMQSPMKPLPSTFWIPESTLTTLLSSHVATGRVLERKSAVLPRSFACLIAVLRPSRKTAERSRATRTSMNLAAIIGTLVTDVDSHKSLLHL